MLLPSLLVPFEPSYPPNPAQSFSPTRSTDCYTIDYPGRALSQLAMASIVRSSPPSTSPLCPFSVSTRFADKGRILGDDGL
jgi:hypothetical protein